MIDVWHDCDPGHDDAIALMYCLSEPKINLVGVSTVHGNQESYKTFKNALRVLYITGHLSNSEKIKVISGANKPLKRPSQICEEIHGDSGLGGVDWSDIDKKIEELGIKLNSGENQNSSDVADGIHNAFINSKSGKLTILVTGCHTNIPVFCQKYTDDVKTGNINIVAMGGSIDTFGNTGPWSEFNIQIDPEAFNIVLNAFQTQDKKALITLVPIDVTHTVLATKEVIAKLNKENKFENMVINLLYFFKEAYENVFNFKAPPVHDPVAAYYIVHPEDFEVKHEQAVVEIEGKYTSGSICINRYPKVEKTSDIMNEFKEINICRKVNVDKFWDDVIEHLHILAKKSPINLDDK